MKKLLVAIAGGLVMGAALPGLAAAADTNVDAAVAAFHDLGLAPLTSMPDNRQVYRSYDDYNNDMQALATANPSLVAYKLAPNKSIEGRDVHYVEITNNVTVNDGKPVFYLQGAIHGNESAAAEDSMEFAIDVVNQSKTNAKVSALLQKHFGDIKIEELAKPFFCVSSDLTSGRDYIHRTGLLWRALRASVALPGILPPVTAEGGHLLVDGGVMNNLPVDVMAQEARGPIIAVDVSGEIDLHADDERYGERSLFTLVSERMRGSPSIISILMRAGTVGSNLQRRNVRSLADFLYEPPLEGIGMRDWKSFERAIAQGYAYTMLEIQKHGVPLSDSWSAGPALAISRAPGPAIP